MIDVAFFAGVLDARAHVEPDRGRLTVTTKRTVVLEWLAKHTGVEAVTKQREYHKRGCSDHCSERHQHVAQESAYWTVRGLRAAIIADNILPYALETRADLLRLLEQTVWPAHPDKTEIGAAMARAGWTVRTGELCRRTATSGAVSSYGNIDGGSSLG